MLAGHSFGGFYVMTYAARYPGEVAGLVLIDASKTSSGPVSPPKAGSYSFLQHATSLVATTSHLGVGRLIAATSSPQLPASYRNDMRATAATGTEMAGVLGEYGVANRSAAEARRLHSLHGKPLVVLTASQGNTPGWMGWQNQLATLSTNSVHRVEPGAAHASFVEEPEHAAAVTRAIHDVVVAVRTRAPLTQP